MGRKTERLAARQLSAAMSKIPPTVAKGGDSILIDTRTITAGRLGGILRDDHRERLTSGLLSISSLLGKLRWGAGVLINKYVLTKLSLGPEHDMLPDLDEVEITGCRRSARTSRKLDVEADSDSDSDSDGESTKPDVISVEVVHDALRCIMIDSNIKAPYKTTNLYAQLCTERATLDIRNVLGDGIKGNNLARIVQVLAKRMVAVYQTHIADCKALLANHLCVLYQDMHLSRKEADSLAQSIMVENVQKDEISKHLPRPRLRQTRWWYRGKRTVKRPKVTKQKWMQIVLQQRKLLPRSLPESVRMHKLYGMYQGINAFLLSPLGACKARHVQLLPSFELQPYHVPLTMNCLSDVLKRQGTVVKQDAILKECFDFKKMNRATGLRINAAAAGGGERVSSFFHHKRVMRPEFITTNGYTVNIHTSSVLTKLLLLDDVKVTVREQGRAVDRMEIFSTIAKRLRHFGPFNKSDQKGISMVLNWLVLDGSLVLEEGEEDKLLWSLPEDAAMEVDVEMLAAAAAPAPAPTLAPAPPSPIYPALPAPTAAAPDATTAAKASGIPSAEPWIIVDPGEHSVIYSVKASTTDRCGRREQQSLGHGQYPVLQPCLDVSKSFWKHLRRFDEIKKLKKKSGVTDIFLQTRRESRSRPLQEWQKVIQDFDILKVAVNEGKKESRISFTVQQRQMKGESDVRKVCKEAFGRKGKIAWGSGSWRKGQASGVLLKILLKDDNLRQRIEQTSEVNTSCKCSNCLDIFKMVHPSHPTHGRENQNREVWGMYQCQNRKCNMTWHRDKGGTGGIFRRAYCSEFGLALPVTYITTGKASLRKRPRQDNSLMGDELKSKRKR